MAIKIVGNYAKRLGLPGYSSHQFSVSVETELIELDQVEGEVTRIYGLLQEAVDKEIQETGFVPDENYGRNSTPQAALPPARSEQPRRINGNGNGNGSWACSEKQRQLILRLVSENNLDRDMVEQTALDRFGKGVTHLNKLQASGLISELIESLSKGTRKKGGTR